jgi:hypothetical protein
MLDSIAEAAPFACPLALSFAASPAAIRARAGVEHLGALTAVWAPHGQILAVSHRI